MQDIPTFADLPVDIIDRICKYLFLPGEDFKQQVDLLSLSTTCRVGYECARALLWQNAYVNFQQRSLHELRVLQRLQIVLSTPNHPIFTLTKRIQILLPRWGLNLPRDELDAVVGALIARMTSLKQIYIRLSGHTDPDVRFHHTLESIFRHEQLVSVSLTNYAGNRKFDTQVKPSITDLTLGQNGIPLALDLHSFPHLRRLHLSTNCYDDGSHNLTHWQIPSSLWRTLDTFVLHVGDGWAHAFLVSQAVMDSVQVAGHTNLSKLGILLKSNACQDKVLRNTLIRASPKIDILALATFDTPNSAYIEELATICPQLRELTLCFFETGKARRWPDTSSDYAAAFSNFEHLSRLALNHDDTARDPYESNTDSDTESDEGSFEDRFLARKEQRVQGRQALCQDLAMSCPSLTEVAFCPLEQEQSRWRVKRKGDAAAEISCIDAVDKFFWQTLWLS